MCKGVVSLMKPIAMFFSVLWPVHSTPQFSFSSSYPQLQSCFFTPSMVKTAVSCADDVLKNTTSECAKLNSRQQNKFNLISSWAWDVHKNVCETEFSSKFHIVRSVNMSAKGEIWKIFQFQ